MSVHRRAALVGFVTAGAALPLLIAQAKAQTQPAASGGMDDYVMQTLMVGTVSLKSSEVAARKATDPNVKQFAELEVAEQQTIASVLAATPAGTTPPDLPPERQAKIDQLNDMQAGPDFDQAYIQAQIEGHNELLQIQQSASGNREASVEAVTARLAEQAVASHIAMLNLIQQLIGAQAIQNVQGGQNPDGTMAPEQGAAPAAGGDAAPAPGGGDGGAAPAEGAAPSSTGS